jgi:cytochrome-b5 reductase
MFARQSFRCAQPLKQVSLALSLQFEKKDWSNRLLRNHQSFRKYSAEAAPKKSNLTPIYVAVGLAGVGVGLYRYSSGDSSVPAAIKLEDRPKVFTGDWVDLKLANIEILSHNTKRFRFEFEDKEAVSGLPIACQFFFRAGLHPC